MSIDPIQGGLSIEKVIADWIFDKFAIQVRIVNSSCSLLAWQHFIIVKFHNHKVESGSWCRPQSLHLVAIGDPEFFEKLEELIRIRFTEISKDYGYAGQLSS